MLREAHKVVLPTTGEPVKMRVSCSALHCMIHNCYPAPAHDFSQHNSWPVLRLPACLPPCALPRHRWASTPAPWSAALWACACRDGGESAGRCSLPCGRLWRDTEPNTEPNTGVPVPLRPHPSLRRHAQAGSRRGLGSHGRRGGGALPCCGPAHDVDTAVVLVGRAAMCTETELAQGAGKQRLRGLHRVHTCAGSCPSAPGCAGTCAYRTSR